MGQYISKEWTEVVTTGSPEAPVVEEGVAEGAVAKRRVLQFDPRSISDDVTRTPIQVEKSPNESTPKNPVHQAFIDPRSPSTDLPRTPLASGLGKHPLYFDDDSLEMGADQATAAEEFTVPAPKRGAVAITDIKGIEEKMEDLIVAEIEESKEEGEITHDDDSDDGDDEVIAPVLKTPVKAAQVAKSLLEEIIRSPAFVPLKTNNDSYEKEEGEITHDSDEDEENKVPVMIMPIKKTPIKQSRTKSTLENDCRSPLLIESSEEPLFEKALSSELAAMASKNLAKKKGGATANNPLLERNAGNDDSLII